MSETVQIPKGWIIKKISDLTESYSGGTPSTSHPEYWDNGTIPWLRSGKLKDNIITSSDDFITESGLKNSSAKLYPPESVLVAITGATTGKTAFLKIKACGTQNVFGILPCEEIISTYLWYYMRYYYRKLLSKSIGGAQGHVNGTIIKQTPVKFPSEKQTQKKIVQKLDDILRQLEEKRKAVFSIIDQNKEKIDFFEKNWLSFLIDGEIEKHPQRKKWKLERLDSITLKITDGEHFRPKTQELGVPFLSAKDIREDGPNFKNCLFVSEDDAEKFRKRCNPEQNDILMVSRGATIARTCINNQNEIFCLLGSVILLKLKSGVNSDYFCFWLKSNSTQKKLLEVSGSSAQQAIYLRDLKNLEIPLPSLSIQKQIVQNIKNTEEKFESQKNQFENIKQNYENTIKYINHMQSSILDLAFSGKLVQ